MSNRDVNTFERGTTQLAGRTPAMLGRTFEYLNYSSSALTTLRDNRLVKMMVVTNGEASAALLPGQLVAWKTGLQGTKVVNPAASAGVAIAGVVDWLIPAAGAAAGYDFLIIIFGPARFLIDANATVAEGDNLINSASVAGCVRTGTTAGAVVGRAEAAAAAGGGALATATTCFGFFSAVGAGP